MSSTPVTKAVRAVRRGRHSKRRYLGEMGVSPFDLIEFPADDPERACRFWSELLGLALEPRREGEGSGWQTRSEPPRLGVHPRGGGPGDSFSLPYFAVDDLQTSLARVEALGGTIVHPGERWAICKDSEGSPFGLAAKS